MRGVRDDAETGPYWQSARKRNRLQHALGERRFGEVAVFEVSIHSLSTTIAKFGVLKIRHGRLDVDAGPVISVEVPKDVDDAADFPVGNDGRLVGRT